MRQHLVRHTLAAPDRQAGQAKARLIDERCAVAHALNVVQLQGAHVCQLPEPLAVELQGPYPSQVEVLQPQEAGEVGHVAARRIENAQHGRA